jgi:hypothetical protein
MTRQTLEPAVPGAAFVTEWATDPPLHRSPRSGLSPLGQPRFICASCGVEIRGPATFHVGVAFCCAGCVAGGPCTCSYDPMPSGVE